MLHPDRVLSQEKQLPMANAFRVGVAGNVRPDNPAPLLLEREFHHAALKTMGLHYPCEEIGKRGERSTGVGHAGAHLSPRCARGQVEFPGCSRIGVALPARPGLLEYT